MNLNSIANRISAMDVGAHHVVMEYLKENNVAFTKNNNGVFVDLSVLTNAEVDGLVNLIDKYDSNIVVDDEYIEEVQSIPWLENIDSKSVIDKADDIIRRHMATQCNKVITNVCDTTSKRKGVVARKNFVSANRRSEIYDQCQNALSFDIKRT